MAAEDLAPGASMPVEGASTSSPLPPPLLRYPTVAFDTVPDQLEIVEKSPNPTRNGNKNLEIRRELTQEDKELSRANYDHLEKERSHTDDEKGDHDGTTANQTDIREHRYTAERLEEALETKFDLKTPASSFGLSSTEAAARLARNGPNVLTPPKKKSALQKVSRASLRSGYLIALLRFNTPVLRLPAHAVQSLAYFRRNSRVYPSWC